MIERRFVSGAEVRAKDDGHIDGHAAVFDQEYVMWDSDSYRVVEKVKPGTFERALKEKQDVRALYNHDANQVLGRTTAKTLSMKEDDQGLYFDCAPPDTQVGRDVVTLVKRGDISGCSFAFSVTGETVTEEKIGKQVVRTREISDVDLYDVGPVTYPAYTGTDVNARSFELRSVMFPAGVPASVLKLIPELRASSSDEEACRCRCRACFSSECDECEMHMVGCGDDSRCDHSMSRAARSSRDDKPTKRVDSEDLTSDCFIYVGDAQKPATWSLPWKFKTAAKIKSHLRNALARFNQTEKIPADSKAGAWKKLVRLCKKYGIKVTDDEAKSCSLTAEQCANLRDTIGGGKNCECDCPECLVGDCEHCSEPDCEDDQCNHDGGDHADDDDRAAALIDVDARMRQAGLKPTA